MTLVAVSALLLGCAGTKQPVKPTAIVKSPPKPPVWLKDELFGPPPEIIQPAQLFELSPTQLDDFHQFANSIEEHDKDPNRIVADYLKSHLDQFNYYSDTLRAKDSLLKQQGNCLSLAIVTKALANIVGVDVSYQLVETTPVYQKEGNVIVSSQHVRTKLLSPKKAPEKNRFTIIRGGIIIDYFPERGSHLLRNVDESEFRGMYYRNKAAEALLRKDYDRAYWLARTTLSLNPTDPHALNLVALAYSNKGDNKTAEAVYKLGLKQNDDKLDLLSNYYYLLKKQGKHAEAESVQQKLLKYDNQNPFRWISLANKAYNAKDYALAKRYYRKAKKLAPYLHQAYAGIAQSEAQLGDLDSAQEALNQALDKAHRRKTKDLYQSKLNLLSQLLKNNRPNR